MRYSRPLLALLLLAGLAAAPVAATSRVWPIGPSHAQGPCDCLGQAAAHLLAAGPGPRRTLDGAALYARAQAREGSHGCGLDRAGTITDALLAEGRIRRAVWTQDRAAAQQWLDTWGPVLVVEGRHAYLAYGTITGGLWRVQDSLSPHLRTVLPPQRPAIWFGLVTK